VTPAEQTSEHSERWKLGFREDQLSKQLVSRGDGSPLEQAHNVR
jgi:hypothetical protein